MGSACARRWRRSAATPTGSKAAPPGGWRATWNCTSNRGRCWSRLGCRSAASAPSPARPGGGAGGGAGGARRHGADAGRARRARRGRGRGARRRGPRRRRGRHGRHRRPARRVARLGQRHTRRRVVFTVDLRPRRTKNGCAGRRHPRSHSATSRRDVLPASADAARRAGRACTGQGSPPETTRSHLGQKVRLLPSGAGHDAMAIARDADRHDLCPLPGRYQPPPASEHADEAFGVRALIVPAPTRRIPGATMSDDRPAPAVSCAPPARPTTRRSCGPGAHASDNPPGDCARTRPDGGVAGGAWLFRRAASVPSGTGAAHGLRCMINLVVRDGSATAR